MYKHIAFIIVLSAMAGESNGQAIQVRDLGQQTSFQDTFYNHFGRGRANIAADFDLDGFVDFYIGNPGDASFILRNVRRGISRGFDLHQLLLRDSLAWGGVAFDYDNDGDYDLFIASGANEGIGFDFLFRNDWIAAGAVTGNLNFVDVSEEAGIRGPVPDRATEPIPTSSANAVVADYDRDGYPDIFVSGGIHKYTIKNYPELIGRNTLWHNNGDGTFADATVAAGLDRSLLKSRNSSFIDYDMDGDPDLFENNFQGPNVLWRNNGDGTFTDVTAEMSAPGHDLSSPYDTYGSAVADFNNDGWDDIFLAQNGKAGGGSYTDGHALFLNLGGTGSENVADQTLINDDFEVLSNVMGFQVGDMNGDGFPDICLGHGTMPGGQTNELFLSSGDGAFIPAFTNESALIDFPARVPASFTPPMYPYRTHGISLIDFDNDGNIELSIVNGGPAAQPDTVREPNRLFSFKFPETGNYLKVRLVGNGTTVSRDAVGAHVSVRARTLSGEDRAVYRTLLGGNGFSAQNGFDLHFGVGSAKSITTLRVVWPDGSRHVLSGGLSLNTSIVVELDEGGNAAWRPAHLTGARSLSTDERPALTGNYPNPFNPSTTIEYYLPENAVVRLEVFTITGERVRVLQDDFLNRGPHQIRFDATGLPTGIYFTRLQAGGTADSRKLLFLK